MLSFRAVHFSVFLGLASCDWSFPPGFKFGAATSSYQIEGSYNISESIWHRFSHTPGKITDGSSGDVACDSYRLWEEDVRIAKELGLDYYRFSISWPRLLPTGFPDRISEDGKNYYNNLIDGLLENGIEPLVTIYHWDLPQRLQDHGGWSNPFIADWFAAYARVVFSLYGDRVKTWITINEPIIFCDFSYNVGILAPGLKDPQFGNFLCNKHTLVAHAKAWRVYDKEFRHKFHGKVSYSNAVLWVEPFGKEDTELANFANDYGTGMYSHAVYSKEGGWPSNVEKLMAEYSKRQGYPWSVLPAFTKEEIELVRGTYDFYGLNFYVSRAVRQPRPDEEISNAFLLGIPPLGAVMDTKPDWAMGEGETFSIYPEGFRKQLNWLKDHYGNLEYVVTEIGYPDTGNTMDDVNRIGYLADHMEQLLLAIRDGVNVTRLTIWSLTDNFEWSNGFMIKFGLYAVNFTSPERTRTPRASARFYADVIKNNSLDVASNHKCACNKSCKRTHTPMRWFESTHGLHSISDILAHRYGFFHT